jgi:hypothetical protein
MTIRNQGACRAARQIILQVRKRDAARSRRLPDGCFLGVIDAAKWFAPKLEEH